MVYRGWHIVRYLDSRAAFSLLVASNFTHLYNITSSSSSYMSRGSKRNDLIYSCLCTFLYYLFIIYIYIYQYAFKIPWNYCRSNWHYFVQWSFWNLLEIHNQIRFIMSKSRIWKQKYKEMALTYHVINTSSAIEIPTKQPEKLPTCMEKKSPSNGD